MQGEYSSYCPENGLKKAELRKLTSKPVFRSKNEKPDINPKRKRRKNIIRRVLSPLIANISYLIRKTIFRVSTSPFNLSISGKPGTAFKKNLSVKELFALLIQIISSNFAHCLNPIIKNGTI